MYMKKILLFILANVLLLAVVWVFLIQPAAESLQVARASSFLAESRYAAGRSMALAFEENLLEIESAEQIAVIHYSEFPIALSEISGLAARNNLHQLNFVANEPIAHDVLGFGDVLEMRVRAEYTGHLDDMKIFLNHLHKAHVHSVETNFEYNQQVRINLEFSIFALAE